MVDVLIFFILGFAAGSWAMARVHDLAKIRLSRAWACPLGLVAASSAVNGLLFWLRLLL